MKNSLQRINAKVTEFVGRYQEEEKPSMVGRLGKVAAVGAAVAGAGYLRGRMGMSSARAGALGPARVAGKGFSKFGQDAKNAFGGLRSAFAPAAAPAGPQLALPAPGMPAAPMASASPVAPSSGPTAAPAGVLANSAPKNRLQRMRQRQGTLFSADDKRLVAMNAKITKAVEFATGADDMEGKSKDKSKGKSKGKNPFAKFKKKKE